MFSPIRTMFMYFPLRAYTTVLILLLISGAAFVRNRRKWKSGQLTGLQSGARWLLVSYILLLLFFTVLGRRSQDFYRWNFDIGYSFWDAVQNGTPATIALITVNIAIFLPVGFFGYLGAKHRGLLHGTMGGFLLSVGIELSQYLLRNGTCEIDDLISNTFGALCGVLLAKLLLPVFRLLGDYLTKRSSEQLAPIPAEPEERNPTIVYYRIELME